MNFPPSLPQMQFMLLFSRQGKLRLQKWYVPLSDKERKKISRDLVQTILARKPKMCSFLEWRDLKIVYKRCVNKISLHSPRWHLSYASNTHTSRDSFSLIKFNSYHLNQSIESKSILQKSCRVVTFHEMLQLP